MEETNQGGGKSMMEDPTVRTLRRWMQVLQEEWGNFIEGILRGTFSPAMMVQFLKCMGIDISQFQEMMQSTGTNFDPYWILKLDRSASDEEVKKRYRELVGKLHPDKSGTAGTSSLFQMVLTAYEMIKKERGWT
jgi:hypothetical protein